MSARSSRCERKITHVSVGSHMCDVSAVHAIAAGAQLQAQIIALATVLGIGARCCRRYDAAWTPLGCVAASPMIATNVDAQSNASINQVHEELPNIDSTMRHRARHKEPSQRLTCKLLRLALPNRRGGRLPFGLGRLALGGLRPARVVVGA